MQPISKWWKKKFVQQSLQTWAFQINNNRKKGHTKTILGYIFIQLGSVLLHTTSEDEWIDEKKIKKKKKLHSNENIDWHCMQLELKSDSIKFILKFN